MPNELVELLMPGSGFELRRVPCTYGQGLLGGFLWSDCVQVSGRGEGDSGVVGVGLNFFRYFGSTRLPAYKIFHP